MKKTLLISLLMLSPLFSFAAGTLGTYDESYEKLIKDAFSGVLGKGIPSTNDVETFCRLNGTAEGFDSDAIIAVEEQGYKPDQKNLLVDQLTRNFYVSGTWTGDFVPSKDYRLALYIMKLQQYKDIKTAGSLLAEKDYAFAKVTAFETINPKSIMSRVAQDRVEQYAKADTQQKAEYEAGFMQTAFICKDLTFLGIPSCSRDLQYILKIARPTNNVMLFDLWTRIFDDKDFAAGFLQAASYIHKHIANNETPNKTLFDVFYDSYLQLGESPRDANENAWQAMAFMATGGAQTHLSLTFMGINMPVLEQALVVIGYGAHVLDRMTVSSGFLFSFPRQYLSKCDTGKSYHFWMSAYLARQANKKNRNTETSAIAAFSVDKAYQFAKKGKGRDPLRPFISPVYDFYSNTIRIDLINASAGAILGAASLDPKTAVRVITTEQAHSVIYQAFRGAIAVPNPQSYQSFPELTSATAQVQIYSTWKELMNSDKAFNSFKGLLD